MRETWRGRGQHLYVKYLVVEAMFVKGVIEIYELEKLPQRWERAFTNVVPV